MLIARIDLYFERVQFFMPLLHRPRFYQQFVTNGSRNKYHNLTRETMFLLYSMMSLSARYSSSSYFRSISIMEKGALFAGKAHALYNNMEAAVDAGEPTIQFLQGCVMLAYYTLTDRPPKASEPLVDVCMRHAYRLGLNEIDKDDSTKTSTTLSPQSWVLKEEGRRLWWCIWELDAFHSVSSRKPFSIDKIKFHVQLPVSDDAWFSEQLTPSVFDSNFLTCWHVLRDSPNQDERAWFLISNYIMVHVHGLGQNIALPSQVDEAETVVSCFYLLFYERFRTRLDSITYQESSYRRNSWIIFTQLMIFT